MNVRMRLAISGLFMLSFSQLSQAACSDVTRAQFEVEARAAVSATNIFGFGLPMWMTMVDETGKVCHVYATDGVNNVGGANAGNSAWLGSRIISAQKANTANAFSLDGLSIATGAIYVAVVPGGSLYGLQHSNPVDASKAYGGSPDSYGRDTDFLKNKRIGGVNVFGGGVALYKAGVKVGAVGASGDTSCRDHAVAYSLRRNLDLNQFTALDGIAVDVLTLVARPAALGQHPICGVRDPTNAANVGIIYAGPPPS